MSRSLFRRWGVALPQDVFAHAVAALGVLGPRTGAIDDAAIAATARRLRRGGGDLVPFDLRHLVQGAARAAAGRELAPAERYAAAWDRLRSAYYEAGPRGSPFLRIEIDPRVGQGGRATAPALPWVVGQLLGGESPPADAAYVRIEQPDRPVAWEWPLRVGVLDDPGSRELAACVGQVPWPWLIRPVRLAAVDEDCDLLLLPDDLPGALARVLGQPRRLRADCVIVLGGAGVPTERLLPLAGALRSEVLTAGVGVAAIDPDRHGAWFAGLVEELSHGMSLDMALVRSRRAAAGTLPLLLASRRLVANASVTAFAGRFGQQLRRMAAARAGGSAPDAAVARGLDAAGKEFESRAASGAFVAESGDASVVARIRRDVDAVVGAPVAAARAGAPPARRDGRDERRVNFTVTDVTAAAQPVAVHDGLARDRAYELALFIGLPRAGVGSAAERFPSEQLPPSAQGHWLDVFFVPLVRAASGRTHTPQQGRLFLPPAGDSTACTFSFRTHGVAGDYRARLLVTHDNRILQTLLFSGPLSGTSGQLALAVENVVAPSFDPAWQGQPFDAAIVVNHAADGRPGFTALVGGEVSFLEPEGIATLVGEVKRRLSAEASFPASRGSLDDPALLTLFDELAHYGRSILKAMPVELQERLPAGARVQIVEARAGAYLPVEIFYDTRLPRPGATLCPHALAALRGEAGVRHETCPHRDDRDHHCPLRFWAFNRVIERQPPLTTAGAADYTLTVPRAGADRLQALHSVLIGASQKVRAADLTDPGGIVAAAERVAGAVRVAKDWDEWERTVQTDSPTLLLLFPHSQEDPQHPGITGLEIGGALLTRPNLESTYVVGPDAAAPVVLLLGCSTQVTDVPFLNFVEAFKRERAALVIGTLATIRGRRTVAFVADLLDRLKAASGSDRTFGDLFLETKRRLLANGDGFVLSLTAYGDVGWRV